MVFITGPGRSGSTLLDLLLGSHSSVTSVGEVQVLSSRSNIDRAAILRRLCTCGAPEIKLCPFWRAVQEEMKSSHELTLSDLDTWHEDPVCYIQHNTTLYSAVSRVSGCRYVVNSSKNMNRFESLKASGVFDLRAINLMHRAPGRVHSLLKDRDNWIVKDTDDWVKLARAHRRKTMRVREIMSGLDDYHRVRYEQLATAPRETVCGIMNWLGLEFEESQLDWTAHQHHNLGGNRMRRGRKKEIVLDDAWKTRLSPLQMAGIVLITWPAHLPGKRTYRLVGPLSRIRGLLRKLARKYGYWPSVRLAGRLARMLGYRK